MERFDQRPNINSRVATPEHIGHVARNKPFIKRKFPLISLVIIVLALIAGGVWYYLSSSLRGQIDNGYQAVFLTNGQVYFGKMQVVNGSYIKITNVYYIQSKTAGTQQAASVDTNSVELIKLVSAVHGPKDALVINRDQVLFFENLKDDGQAAKLIAADKSKQ